MARRPVDKKVKPRTYRGIQVTQDMIDHSIRGDSQRCMVRNAVATYMPDAKRIVVDLQFVRFTLDGVRYRYHVPTKAAYNLARFESGENVDPFTFTLEGTNAVAFVTNPPSSPAKPGAASHIRLWAVSKGLMTTEQAERKTTIPRWIKDAYLVDYPEVAQTVNNPRDTTRMRSTKTHQATKADRFFGLRLQTGFKSDGTPT